MKPVKLKYIKMLVKNLRSNLKQIIILIIIMIRGHTVCECIFTFVHRVSFFNISRYVAGASGIYKEHSLKSVWISKEVITPIKARSVA